MKILDPVSITGAILLSTNVPETDAALYDQNAVYGPGERVIVQAEHTIYQQLRGTQSGVVISIAMPGVVSWAAHGLYVGAAIKFKTTGALPSPLVAGVTYYVVSLTADTFQVSATVGGAAIATTGGQSGAHTCVSNLPGLPPKLNPMYWAPIAATNAWMMFDAYNNTQTANAESIVISLKPGLICTGLFLGGVDATSVEVEVSNAAEGVVFSRVENLNQSTSRSSFWNWCFQRIVRRNVFVSTDMPPYRNATITVRIKKPGGIAKCGMCCVGMVQDMGQTLNGLETEIKDYSSEKFNVDGSSETIVRGFTKRMVVSLCIDNDRIDSVQDTFTALRRRPVVWIAAPQWRWTTFYGTYESFKNVIPGYPTSRMALTINGKI